MASALNAIELIRERQKLFHWMRWPLESWMIGLCVLAFWPVWRWYAHRLMDGSDDPWGLAALALAVLSFCLHSKGEATEAMSLGETPGRGSSPFSIKASIVFLLCYSAGYSMLTPLPRALLALGCIATMLSAARFDKRLHVGFAGLLLLSLPVVASLQFYLGYPLRSLTAMIAAPLLRMNGLAVTPQGTALNWAGRLIEIDAPCSGVKMVWAILLLCFTLICFLRLNSRRAAELMLLSLVLILSGNVLRSTALFYLEAGLLPLRGFLTTTIHTGIGFTVFMFAAGLISWRAVYIKSDSAISRPVSINREAPHRYLIIFILCSISAAIVPFFSFANTSNNPIKHFRGWPAQIDGRTITQLPLSPREERFAANFPGRIGRFSDGTREIILRWVEEETRLLHPAADCVKGLGYSITHAPLHIDDSGQSWSRFLATRSGESLRISERIYSVDGKHSWTDASSWYWHSLLSRQTGPYWAVTVAETVPSAEISATLPQ